jgi:hypothetical protein
MFGLRLVPLFMSRNHKMGKARVPIPFPHAAQNQIVDTVWSWSIMIISTPSVVVFEDISVRFAELQTSPRSDRCNGEILGEALRKKQIDYFI